MEKVLKIGIIGCGAIGKDHCRRIIETVPGATVVAVSDYVAAAADDTAAKYGITNASPTISHTLPPIMPPSHHHHLITSSYHQPPPIASSHSTQHS